VYFDFKKAYNHLALLVASQADYETAIAPARAPIDAAIGADVGDFTVLPATERTPSGELRFTDGVSAAERFMEPLVFEVYPTKAAADTAWEEVLEALRNPVTQACKKWSKHGESALASVERTFVAQGHMDFGLVDIQILINQPNALPPSMRSKPKVKKGKVLPPYAAAAAAAAAARAALAAAAAPAAADDFEDFDTLETVSKGTIARDFKDWLGARTSTDSLCYISAEDKENMGAYWLRVRDKSTFKTVATVMLWWLSHPIGTAGVERDFCGLTIITRNFRRNRQGFEAFRGALLSVCHKKALHEALEAEVLLH
jgi:hypothetical protein